MKINNFLKLVIIFSVLIIAQPVNAGCTWRGRHITTSAAGGTAVVSDPFGGCIENENEAQSNETCGEDKPADKEENDITGKSTHTTYICCCNSLTLDTTRKEPKFTAPDLQIPIPNLAFSNKVDCTQNVDSSWGCSVPYLSQYIIAIFNYGLSIAGILAALVLMAGGLLWLASAGSQTKISQAKELITGSLVGLVILFSSYVILVQVNPDLIQMKSLAVGTIKGVDLVENGSDSQNNASSSASCLTNSDLISVDNLVSITCAEKRLGKNAYEGLKKAIAEAKKQNVELEVHSAYRTYREQKIIWTQKLKEFNGDEKKTRKYVANPDTACSGKCASHCSGAAIDVCIKNSTTCTQMHASSASIKTADVTKLQNIMKAAGWLRYCNEWWHFQYGLKPGVSCSP